MVGETEQLWRQYVEKRSPEIRRTLIESYAPLARYVVDRLNLKPGPALEYDDLLSQAVVGLIDAVDRFDPTRGVKFETYAYYRIRGAVMDMLRELDWLPRSVRQREAQLSSAYARLEDRLRRPPTDEELARELGVTVDQLDRLAQDVALQSMQSLDEAVASYGWEIGSLGDLVADQSAPSPEGEIERRGEREMVARAIEALPDAERTVVSLYYYEGLTLKEIGRVMGVTESRVCQIHGKAVLRLRARVQSLLKSPAQGTKILPRTGPAPVKAGKFTSDAAGP
ncbi:MAG TPA: FliA/WhiG family RNA polymerase sigma factor [Armatimonadota bacterium]|nr:FliA/WhiG family RNA polymerase sigma factor [Armatimonadota bacterium]